MDNDRPNRHLLTTTLILLIACLAGPVTAQTDDSTCSSLTEAALTLVADSCSDLGRNQACYGNNRVDVTFWEEQAVHEFNAPADRIPLIDLQTIATAPLNLVKDQWGVAVLNLQANLPRTLPGQAVTFLLMGDTTLENAVSPDDAVDLGIPRLMIATVNANANLRSAPTTTANILGGLTAGDSIELIGKNDAGDWFEVALGDGGSAWIWSQLVDSQQVGGPQGSGQQVGLVDIDSLPVTYDADEGSRYGPMQAFYFAANIGASTCQDAPDALVVHSPQNTVVNLTINQLTITLGSTVVFTWAEQDGAPVLVGTLIEGTMTAESEWLDFTLAQPGDTFAVSVNDDGLVDNSSALLQTVDDDWAEPVLSACQNASKTGLIEGLALADCDVALTTITSSAPEDETAATDSLAGIADDAACTVMALNSVNLRGGPGTNYYREGQLAAGDFGNPDGKATGADGFVWWRLDIGSWVRSDLVDMAGDCASVPVVETPEPPVTETSDGGPPGNNGNVVVLYSGGSDCPLFAPAGQTYHVGTAIGPFVDPNTALNSIAFGATLDGQPVPPAGGLFISQGNWIAQHFNAGALPAGTYTVVLWHQYLADLVGTDGLTYTGGPHFHTPCTWIIGQ